MKKINPYKVASDLGRILFPVVHPVLTIRILLRKLKKEER